MSHVSVCPGSFGLVLDKRRPNSAVVIGFEPLPSGVCGGSSTTRWSSLVAPSWQ